MATLVSDTFTGANGAAWSATNWTAGVTGSSGAGVTIQTNQGRMRTGTGTNYNFAQNGCSRRVNVANQSNIRVTGKITVSGNCFPRVNLRDSGSQGNVDGESGYDLMLPAPGESNILIIRNASWAGTQIATAAFTMTASVQYSFIYEMIGTTVRAKIWATSGSEPGSWTVSATDATYASGRQGIAVSPGGTATIDVLWDDIIVSDGVDPVNATVSATTVARTAVVNAPTVSVTVTASTVARSVTVNAPTITAMSSVGVDIVAEPRIYTSIPGEVVPGASTPGTDDDTFTTLVAWASVPTPSITATVAEVFDAHSGTLAGVNVAGGEFGSSYPGTYDVDYHYDSAETLAYLARRFNVVRLPIRWERVQHTLNGALDTDEMNRIYTVLDNARRVGLYVIVDLHNYARYFEGVTERVIGDGYLTKEHLADVWVKLSTAFKNKKHSHLIYGLMNEPHDMVGSFASVQSMYDWNASVQGWAVEAGSVVLSTDTVVKRTGAGSLKAVASMPIGTNVNAQIGDQQGGTVHDYTTGGASAFSTWVYLPADAPGTNLQARILVQNSSYVYQAGNDVALTKGAWTQVTYTPTFGTMSAARQIVVQVSGDFASASTLTYNVDSFERCIVTSGAITWESAAQHTISAIRGNTDTTKITVAGYDWSSAKNWPTVHPAPFITDPANNFAYEGHFYFDIGNSGFYNDPYSTVNTDAINNGYADLQDRAQSELHNFVNWCDTHNVHGFVGEIGWPHGADAAQWNAVGQNLLQILSSNKISWTYWAVGEWFGTGYPLSPYTGTPVSTAEAQAAILEQFTDFNTVYVSASVNVPTISITVPSTVAPLTVARTATVNAPSTSANVRVTMATTIARVATVNAPTIASAVSRTVNAVTVARTATVNAPTVGASNGATVIPAIVARAASVSAPTINLSRTVSPPTVSVVAEVKLAAIRTGSTVLPPTVQRVATVNNVAISSGSGMTAIPSNIPVIATVNTPTVLVGNGVTVNAATVARVATVNAAVANAGQSGTTNPGTVNVIATVNTPIVTVHPTTIPATVPVIATVNTPVITSGMNPVPGTVARTATVNMPSVQAQKRVVLTTINVVASVNTPVVNVGQNPSTSTVARIATVYVPSVNAGSSSGAAPTTIVTSATVNAPLVSASVHISGVPTVPVTATVNAPAMKQDVTVRPNTVNAVATVNAVGGSSNAAVTAATVTATATVNASIATLSTIVNAQTVARAATVHPVGFSIGGTVVPLPINATAYVHKPFDIIDGASMTVHLGDDDTIGVTWIVNTPVVRITENDWSDLDTPPIFTPWYTNYEIQRDLTHMYIMENPFNVQLVPNASAKTHTGGYVLTAGLPRVMQTVRFIEGTTAVSQGQIRAADGFQEQDTHMLLMEWDADIAINDTFEHNGHPYVVIGIMEHNGYETRAEVMRRG